MSILASIKLESLPVETLADCYDKAKATNETLVNIDGFKFPLDLITERLLSIHPFIKFYNSVKEVRDAEEVLKSTNTETLLSTWEDWDGSELIKVNSVTLDERHLYHELRNNRNQDICYC